MKDHASEFPRGDRCDVIRSDDEGISTCANVSANIYFRRRRRAVLSSWQEAAFISILRTIKRIPENSQCRTMPASECSARYRGEFPIEAFSRSASPTQTKWSRCVPYLLLLSLDLG